MKQFRASNAGGGALSAKRDREHISNLPQTKASQKSVPLDEHLANFSQLCAKA